MQSESRVIIDGLLAAYRQGAFPMADPDSGFIGFYHAPRRGIFPIELGDPAGSFHVPRSLRRRVNAQWFDIRSDTDFAGVVRGCAAPRMDDPETWINEDIAHWFQILHDAGHAHSVEAWRTDPNSSEEVLVGGIYGIAIGGLFCGESMFSRPLARLAGGERHPLDGTDASKVCLIRLAHHLQQRGFVLFDTQLPNPHLDRFGCAEISHKAYMRRLERALAQPVTWGEFAD